MDGASPTHLPLGGKHDLESQLEDRPYPFVAWNAAPT